MAQIICEDNKFPVYSHGSKALRLSTDYSPIFSKAFNQARPPFNQQFQVTYLLIGGRDMPFTKLLHHSHLSDLRQKI